MLKEILRVREKRLRLSERLRSVFFMDAVEAYIDLAYRINFSRRNKNV